MASSIHANRFAQLRKRYSRKSALSALTNAKSKSNWQNRAIRFGWLGWRFVAGAIVVVSLVISFLAFRQTQIQNRAWVSATSAQTSIAAVPMGGTLVFFGTTVTLHNSGHQPALKA